MRRVGLQCVRWIGCCCCDVAAGPSVRQNCSVLVYMPGAGTTAPVPLSAQSDLSSAMSLKRKLTLDDDDVAQDSVSVVLPPQPSAVSAGRTVSSSASTPSPPSSSSSATAKRPRLHDHHASASRPPPRHQHSSQRLQRPTETRPRSSSAPCPSTLRTPSDKFIYPPWTPDVTRESLRSLDLDVLQSNVQFREWSLLLRAGHTPDRQGLASYRSRLYARRPTQVHASYSQT